MNHTHQEEAQRLVQVVLQPAQGAPDTSTYAICPPPPCPEALPVGGLGRAEGGAGGGAREEGAGAQGGAGAAAIASLLTS